jgi:hypothetical protein
LPFKKYSFISSKFFLLISSIFILVFIFIGLLGYLNNGYPARLSIPQEVSDSFSGNKIRERCDFNFDEKNPNKINFCDFGDLNNNATSVAIFGDSHSEAILPLFNKIALIKGQKFTHFGLGGCPPLLNIDVVGSWGSKVCENIANRQYEFVKNNRIKSVVLVARWSLYVDGGYSNYEFFYLVKEGDREISKEQSRFNFKSSLRETIKKYQELGVKVTILAQIPHQNIDGNFLYSKLYWFDVADKEDAVISNSVLKEKHLKLQEFNRSIILQIKEDLNFNYVNLDNFFCDYNKCYIGEASKSWYRDDDHLSTYGALSIYNSYHNFFGL